MNKLLIVIFFMMIGGECFAQNCRYRISVDNVTFNWNSNPQTYTANLRVRRRNQSFYCSYVKIGFSRGLAGSYFRRMYSGSNNVEYNIYKNNQTNTSLKDLNDSNTFDESIYLYYFSGERTLSTTFEVRLPVPNLGRNVVPTGNYSDLVEVSAISLFNPNRISRRSFSVNMNILGQVDISLVNAGGSYDPSATLYTMDFATLQQGEIKNMDLIVKANSGYAISFSSINGGKLKHLSSNYFVPYRLRINGSIRTFGGPGSSVNITNSVPTTANQQRRYTVGVEVGDTQNRLAGEYQDTITITASSTN